MVMNIPNIKISFRVEGVKTVDLDEIKNSCDVARIMRTVHDSDIIGFVEEAYVIALNRANRIVGSYQLSKGGVAGTVVDPRSLLVFALNVGATSLIISHNHPSGSIKPSKQDEELTQKIKLACSYVDIRLLDHIILSPDEDRYFSFADEGLLL